MWRTASAYMRRLHACRGHAVFEAFDPLLDAVGVADAGEFSPRIEQHDDDRLGGDARLHDQAAAGFADVAGLRQADVPLPAAHQPVGVAESNRAVAALLGIHRDAVRILGGELADQGVAVSRVDQHREVHSRGDVIRVQPGRVHEAGVAHAQLAGALVHRVDEGGGAARIGARERGGGTVLGGHQGQPQHVPPRQGHAELEPGSRALQRVHILPADRDGLVERELGVQRHDRRHQLGDGGDRHDCVGVLGVEELTVLLIDHQGHRGVQLELVLGGRKRFGYGGGRTKLRELGGELDRLRQRLGQLQAGDHRRDVRLDGGRRAALCPRGQGQAKHEQQECFSSRHMTSTVPCLLLFRPGLGCGFPQLSRISSSCVARTRADLTVGGRATLSRHRSRRHLAAKSTKNH